jgi:hypothetical protein
MLPESCDVERRSDGTVLVRVHSSDRNGRKLPDAVFSFRNGDPQYTYWAERAVPCEMPEGSLSA